MTRTARFAPYLGTPHPEPAAPDPTIVGATKRIDRYIPAGDEGGLDRAMYSASCYCGSVPFGLNRSCTILTRITPDNDEEYQVVDGMSVSTELTDAGWRATYTVVARSNDAR